MNQHYEFWVQYYEKLKESDAAFSNSIPESNRRLTEREWGRGETTILPVSQWDIPLQVGYPGLLVGLGNSHGSGRAVEVNGAVPPEIKLGFMLDIVTGLPYVPGSTVKGILRSAFLSNRDYVRILLEETGVSLSEEQVELLELDVFGRQHPYHAYEMQAEVGQGRDSFLDAWPVEPDWHAHILGIENITPHRANNQELDGLSEPNPLTLLKVMPGVVVLFRFQLSDSELGNGLTVTAEQKKTLFRSLLLDLGAGAKTNVGFGALAEPAGWHAPETYCYLEQALGPAVRPLRRRVVFSTSTKHVARVRWVPAKGSDQLTREADIEVGRVVAGKPVKEQDSRWIVELIPSQRGRRGRRTKPIGGLLESDKIPDGVTLPMGMNQKILVKIISDKMEGGKRRIGLDLITEVVE